MNTTVQISLLDLEKCISSNSNGDDMGWPVMRYKVCSQTLKCRDHIFLLPEGKFSRHKKLENGEVFEYSEESCY